MNRTELARFIDHTLLKPDATMVQIQQLCTEARRHSFASVCVNPMWVKFCGYHLARTDINVCTVIGFPLGATTSEAKAFEARLAVDHGAREVDMVLNVGALKSGMRGETVRDIMDVRRAIDSWVVLKVIVEACLLTDPEKILACQLAQEAGANFVKTSTGFSTGGAAVEDIRLMRATVGTDMGVKAFGGIRTLADAMAMIEAGANRLGIGQAGSLAIMAEMDEAVQ